MQEPGLGMMSSGGSVAIGGLSSGEVSVSGDQNRQLKAEIATHPLYEQLLAAHVSCLRVATPIDQLPLIEAQLAQFHNLLRSYASQHHQHRHSLSPHERQDLDNFLAQYLIVLCTFKEQLQQHVRVHAVEAVMACREIENNLQALTGVTLGEGTGATMSDDEDDLQMDFSLDQSGADGHDLMGFGPLVPTESERSLMERVRLELKIELKQGFKSRIEDVREEILRKRRAGKLPGDTTTVLKNWWQQHSKWPYPTEDDKIKLVEETGLQLKQINNWFINQRKRNWHSNSQSVTSLKSKRKRFMQWSSAHDLTMQNIMKTIVSQPYNGLSFMSCLPLDLLNYMYFTHKTMQMMYDIIYKALVEVGLENKYEPQDFLNFFCLGNREAVHGGDSLDARGSTATKTPQEGPGTPLVPGSSTPVNSSSKPYNPHGQALGCACNSSASRDGFTLRDGAAAP
ncbi:hypothetical protein CRYUN_Cryun13aG0125400 [Craigia yunnanensis]